MQEKYKLHDEEHLRYEFERTQIGTICGSGLTYGFEASLRLR